MKKLNYFFAIATVMIALLIGCKPKEDKIISPTNENEVPNGVLRTNFLLSVHVIPSAESGRTSGLEGASITVSQNAKVLTKTVNKDGEAVFENLVAGDYTLYIRKEGYASWNSKGTLIVPTSLLQTVPNDNTHEFTISQAEIVKLPALAGALTGTVFYDDDLVANTPLVGASGLAVRLEYDAQIQPNVYPLSVGTDGKFTFTNVPNAEATLVIDGQKTINGKIVKFSVASSKVTPRIGGTATNVGQLIATTTQPQFFDKSGTFKFWPRGNFNFKSQDTVSNPGIEQVLPASSVVTLDFSASITNASEQKIYTGTRDNLTGVWTFTGIPTDKDFVVTFTNKVDIQVDQSNRVLIGPTETYVNNSNPSVIKGSVASTTPTIKYIKTVTFNSLQGGSTFSVAKDATLDLGILTVTE